MSNEEYGPGMWSSEPLGGKQQAKEDASPGAEVAIGGDPFGLSGRGAVDEDAPHKDGAPDSEESRERSRLARAVPGEREQQPSSTPSEAEAGGVPDGKGDLGADRQNFAGPGNPGSIANTGTD